MNITILNGNPDRHNQVFDRYLELYKVKMHHTDHYVRSFKLREMKITDLRSPGFADAFSYPDMSDEFRYIFNSLNDTDLLLIASPLEKGFLSGLTKMILDRLTKVFTEAPFKPSVLPGAASDVGKLPLMGMIMQKEVETTEQDLLRNRLSGERIAANIHTVLDFCITTDTGISEAVCKTFQSIDYNSYIEKTYTDLIAG